MNWRKKLKIVIDFSSFFLWLHLFVDSFSQPKAVSEGNWMKLKGIECIKKMNVYINHHWFMFDDLHLTWMDFYSRLRRFDKGGMENFIFRFYFSPTLIVSNCKHFSILSRFSDWQKKWRLKRKKFWWNLFHLSDLQVCVSKTQSTFPFFKAGKTFVPEFFTAQNSFTTSKTLSQRTQLLKSFLSSIFSSFQKHLQARKHLHKFHFLLIGFSQGEWDFHFQSAELSDVSNTVYPFFVGVTSGTTRKRFFPFKKPATCHMIYGFFLVPRLYCV